MTEITEITEITDNNIRELYNPIAPILRNWAMVEAKMRSFENNANLATFQFIFKDDAERLFESFRCRCNGKYLEFKTFLTQRQLDLLLLNIYVNDDMYHLPMT